MSARSVAVAEAVVARHRDVLAAAAVRHGIAPALLAAIVCQESAGDPFAWRAEPAFLRRYRAGIVRALGGLADPAQRTRARAWFRRDPLVLATSIGLMQTLVVVALEEGVALAYPTTLCDPAVSLEAGCRHLVRHLRTYGGDVDRALRRYNGGAAYPPEVRAWERLTARAWDTVPAGPAGPILAADDEERAALLEDARALVARLGRVLA